MKGISVNDFIALLRLDGVIVRATHLQLQQNNHDERYNVELAFPVVTGSETLYHSLLDNIRNDHPLSSFDINFGGLSTTKYSDLHVRKLSLSIGMKTGVSVAVDMDCVEDGKVEILNETDYLSPARIYTWKDGIAEFKGERDNITTSDIRSVEVTVAKSSADQNVTMTGHVAVLGLLEKFDRNQKGEIAVGYQLNRNAGKKYEVKLPAGPFSKIIRTTTEDKMDILHTIFSW